MEERSVQDIQPPRSIALAGRTFVPTDARGTTFGQDMYVMTHARAAGLDQVEEIIGPERALEEVAFEIISRAFSSGHLFELLAALLVEEGQAWSEERAQENAVFFAAVTDTEAKRELTEAVVGLVLAFFVKGAASSGISLKSFYAADVAGAAPDTDPRSGSAEASRSATSPPSSGSSPAATPSDSQG